MRDAIALAGLLGEPNVKAFLHVIRVGEGTADPDGYRRQFGGALFDSYADHPRKVITAGLGRNQYTSTAAGAYQFLTKTWDGLMRQFAFANFEPATQDIAALALIDGRGALDDVLAGNFDEAVAKCNREWASLPGSPYGQPTRTLAQARATYTAAGGTFAIQPVQETPQEAAMPIPALIGALLPSIIQSIPALGKLFGSGSEVAERNVKAAELAVSIVQQATGAVNAQDAAEKIRADPAVAQAAVQAVQDRWFELVEAGGGGIEGARKADAAFVASGSNPLRSPAFLISLALLAMPFMLLADVFYVHPGNYIDAGIRTQIVTGVLMVVGMVGGYWIGSSLGSDKKTEALTR